jgi:hypothetical protein
MTEFIPAAVLFVPFIPAAVLFVPFIPAAVLFVPFIPAAVLFVPFTLERICFAAKFVALVLRVWLITDSIRDFGDMREFTKSSGDLPGVWRTVELFVCCAKTL